MAQQPVDDDFFWVAGSNTKARRKSRSVHGAAPLWREAPRWEGHVELYVEPVKASAYTTWFWGLLASWQPMTLRVDDVDVSLEPCGDDAECQGAPSAAAAARRVRLDMRSNLAACEDGDEAVVLSGMPLDVARGLPLSKKHVRWRLRIADAAARRACVSELELGMENARQRARYEFTHPPLGKGAGGTVWRATDRFNGHEVAVKIVSATSARRRRAAVREALIMKEMSGGLESAHLVRILSVVDQPTYETSGAIFFVMELCEGGDLFDAVARGGPFAERAAARAARDVARGLAALHARGILHLDIKPENVLYAADGALKIADFGMSRYVDDHASATHAAAEDDRVTRRLRGTVGYVAPEIVAATFAKRPPLYTPACDCFALGVVVYVLLVGAQPFAGDGDDDCLRRILYGSYAMRPEDWDARSPEAARVVRSLLDTDPGDRLSVPALLRDPWLADEAEAPRGDADGVRLASVVVEAADAPTQHKFLAFGVDPDVLAAALPRKPRGSPAVGDVDAPPALEDLVV